MEPSSAEDGNPLFLTLINDGVQVASMEPSSAEDGNTVVDVWEVWADAGFNGAVLS